MTTKVEFQLTYGWNIKLNIGQAIQIVEQQVVCEAGLIRVGQEVVGKGSS